LFGGIPGVSSNDQSPKRRREVELLRGDQRLKDIRDDPDGSRVVNPHCDINVRRSEIGIG
jgi:hypothetical protein